MSLLFEDATPADLELIVDIYNSTIATRMVTADTEPVACEDRLDWFMAHNPATRPLWMVKDGDDVIGWVSFNNFYGRPAYKGTSELSIYLHENARGKGFGKTVLEECLRRAPGLGIQNLLGFIFEHNAPSMKLFINAGFEIWGRLPGIAVMDGNPYTLIILGKKVQDVTTQF